MLVTKGVAAGVQHIRLQEVLRHAGLTTGAAYRLWADQTEYQKDVAVAVVRHRADHPTDQARSRLQSLIDEKAPLDEVLRQGALGHFGLETFASRLFLVTLALRTTADSWPELTEASRERHRDSIEKFADYYSYLMSEYGYRMREPYTVRQFSEAMAALGDGFAVRTLEGLPHLMIEVDGETWPLFGIAARGLVREFMEKV